MPIDQDALAKALEECAREPVHTPNAIQDCGALVSVDRGFGRIHQVSANLEQYLDVSPEQALMLAPAVLFGIRPARVIRSAIMEGKRYFSRSLRRRMPDGARYFRISGYLSNEDRVVLEFEPVHHGGEVRLLGMLERLLRPLVEADDVALLLQRLAQVVRESTGSDRVLVFQFEPDWSGVVRAESRVEGMDSLLEHHFPASDIPPQVRALYDVNPIRSIPDAARDPVPLVPGQDPYVPRPLDMSLGALRAVSPVHREYMRNMGIAGSMSIAMHEEQALWGLLSCHGREPLSFSPAVRDTARILVEVAVQRLFWLEARAEAVFLRQVEASREGFSSRRQRLSPAEVLKRQGKAWLELFRVCGMAVVQGDQIAAFGDRPDDGELGKLAHWVAREHGTCSGCWATDKLGQTVRAAGVDVKELCGLLAIPMLLEGPEHAWFMLFRDEEVKSVQWAGKPGDPPIDENGRVRLGPRHSFETWREEVRGRGARWRSEEVLAALALAENLTVTLSISRVAQLNDELADTNRRLRELAQTDSLTRLWNRFRMEQEIDEELAAGERYGRSCAVLLFDVDHFKSVNDTWGHEVGDRVLTGIADLARSLLRETDHLGRWGGEEFVLLAGSTEAEDAVVVAERVRQEIAAARFPPVEQVTISVGVACCRRGESRRGLVGRADAALYEAKHRGRNQVAVAEALPSR